MDISSLFMASPVMGGYSNFLGNIGSALGANLISYPYQKKMAERQYKYALALQKQSQKHQEYMFQHQHQWRVDDLRAAGLNPILSTHLSSAMPSASSGSLGLGHPSPGSSSALHIDSLARIFNNRYKKENELLDAQIHEIKARTGEFKGRSKVSNALGDIAQEGSSLFSSAKNFSEKFGSYIGSNLGDLFFNRNKSTSPIYGFSARDEKLLDELIKEDDARKGIKWKKVGKRIHIYK